MFSKNLLPLYCLLLALPVCTAGGCDGTRKSERITRTQSKYIHVMPGNQAVINWTWCIAVNSTITGIAIYRVSRVNSRILMNHAVLSMDLSKTVYYLKDNSRYELSSVENKTSFQEKTVFIINNVSEADSGEYCLHVRRVGLSDLHSEVKVVVKTTDPTEEMPLTTSRKEGTKLMSTNNTDLQSGQRKAKNLRFGILPIVIVISVAFVLLTVFLILFLKWKMGGNEARRVLSSICLGSNERSLRSTFKSSDQSCAALVKEEHGHV